MPLIAQICPYAASRCIEPNNKGEILQVCLGTILKPNNRKARTQGIRMPDALGSDPVWTVEYVQLNLMLRWEYLQLIPMYACSVLCYPQWAILECDWNSLVVDRSGSGTWLRHWNRWLENYHPHLRCSVIRWRIPSKSVKSSSMTNQEYDDGRIAVTGIIN